MLSGNTDLSGRLQTGSSAVSVLGMQACAACACTLGCEAVATSGAELSPAQWQKMRHSIAKKLAEYL